MVLDYFKLREQPYVLASRALGASHTRVLFRQILPNAMTPVITAFHDQVIFLKHPVRHKY